jgi:predicted transcriptional regulator
MTAKEKLLEYVSGLTEAEAEDRLPWIVEDCDDSSSVRALSGAERAAIERGLADAKAGRIVTLEDLEAEMEEWDA